MRWWLSWLATSAAAMCSVVSADPAASSGRDPAGLAATGQRYGMALTPVDREQVYEFARQPAVMPRRSLR